MKLHLFAISCQEYFIMVRIIGLLWQGTISALEDTEREQKLLVALKISSGKLYFCKFARDDYYSIIYGTY